MTFFKRLLPLAVTTLINDVVITYQMLVSIKLVFLSLALHLKLAAA